MNLRQALFSRRMLLVLCFGFASGLPLLLATGSTLQAWMTDAQVDLKTVGLFSLVGLPYTFKFLWAPVFDRYTPPFLGRRRGWLVIVQTLLALALGALGLCDPGRAPGVLAAVALTVAFFSASQDILLDAYRRELLEEAQLGLGTSLYVNGYRLGMLFSGAFALWLADQVSWHASYAVMAVTLAAAIVVTLLAPEPPAVEQPVRTLREAVLEPFREYFSRDGALLVLAFILLYKLGDTMAGALSMRLYLELHFTKTEIATAAKTFGLAATLTGGFLGGALMVRLGIWRSLWSFGVLQALTILAYAGLASVTAPTLWLLTAVIALDNFAAGMGTTAYSAYMASLTNRRFTATQYALLSSLMGVPRVLFASSSGYLVAALGWVGFYLTCCALAVPGLLLLVALRPKRSDAVT
jgi:PAT family beta-lactamase induction signal transducer AmpG